MRGGGRAAEDARIVKGADYASDDEEPLRNEDNVRLDLTETLRRMPCISAFGPPVPSSALAVVAVGTRTRFFVTYAHR